MWSLYDAMMCAWIIVCMRRFHVRFQSTIRFETNSSRIRIKCLKNRTLELTTNLWKARLKLSNIAQRQKYHQSDSIQHKILLHHLWNWMGMHINNHVIAYDLMIVVLISLQICVVNFRSDVTTYKRSELKLIYFLTICGFWHSYIVHW